MSGAPPAAVVPEMEVEQPPPQPPAEDAESSAPPKDTPYNAEEDEDDDDNETCGFCIFMKGGGCKEAFNSWSKCVDTEREAGNDFTEECKEATLRLRECMLSNREYYAPLLEEEEREIIEMEAAKAAAAAGEPAKEGGNDVEVSSPAKMSPLPEN